MKRTGKYNMLQRASSILMLLTLCWLIVCLPIVYESQQQVAKQSNMTPSPIDAGEEESGNPLTNTEEKAPNTLTSISEEYLHEDLLARGSSASSSLEYVLKDARIYVAFHGELIVPPPDAA